MIPNCQGCQEELETIKMYCNEDYKLNFAGYGLFERGHLIMILVNDGGEIIIG